MDEDAEFWGIDPELLSGGETEGLWPDHVPAVEAASIVCGQWRTVGAGMGGVVWLGLDYTAVERGLAMAEVKVTPGLWAQIRVIEAGALSALNKGH